MIRHSRGATGAIGLTLVVLAAAAAPARAQERGAFVLLRGKDTLAVEQFERTPTSLRSVLVERMMGMRVLLDAQLTPDALVSGATMKVWRAAMPDTSAPIQQATLVVRGDTAALSSPAGARSFAIRPGALLYQNAAPSYMEQAILRARAAHLDTVPEFALNGMPLTVTVTPQGADSVVLSLAGIPIRVAVDASGRLLGGAIPSQGVTILRATSASLAPPPKPDYSAPPGAPYTAEEVKVPGPAGKLVGTLTRPKDAPGKLPAVVTITGSGPEDRDESLGAVAPGFRPFRQVADTLSRRGIAVLRLDDRGTGESGGTFAGATTRDFADDIEAAVAWLRARPDIDPARIALVGHSEGGIIAPLIAAEDPRLRAIVLLAGTAYDGRKVLRYQMGFGLRRDSALAGARLDSAVDRAMLRVDTAAARDPWLRYFLTYDPLSTARKVRTPVLILQGASDRQVSADQAPLLAAAFRAAGNRDVTMKVFPDHNHLFLIDPTGDPANYGKLPGYRIDAQVMGTLADWLVRKLGAGKEPAAAGRP